MLAASHAEEQHSEDIASVMRASAVKEMRQVTIIGCSGLSRYIRDQICNQEGDRYLVCADGDRIIGMSAWRHGAGTLFLNHLFVHPEAQGKGAGRMLCHVGLALLRKPEERTISLDVFSTNDRARQWYLSLGMQPILKRIWVQVPLGTYATKPSGECTVVRMKDADRAHARYGFSEFTIESPGRSYAVGRLGEGLFRSLTFDLVQDIPALCLLAKLGPDRKLLCIGASQSASAVRHAPCVVVAESERLVGPIDAVMGRLTQ